MPIIDMGVAYHCLWGCGLPIDSGCEEDKVRPQEGLHQRQGNGSCLVNAHQLCLLQPVAVPRMDVLQYKGEGWNGPLVWKHGNGTGPTATGLEPWEWDWSNIH